MGEEGKVIPQDIFEGRHQGRAERRRMHGVNNEAVVRPPLDPLTTPTAQELEKFSDFWWLGVPQGLAEELQSEGITVDDIFPTGEYFSLRQGKLMQLEENGTLAHVRDEIAKQVDYQIHYLKNGERARMFSVFSVKKNENYLRSLIQRMVDKGTLPAQGIPSRALNRPLSEQLITEITPFGSTLTLSDNELKVYSYGDEEWLHGARAERRQLVNDSIKVQKRMIEKRRMNPKI